jgi:hypothetical protein
LRKTRLAWLGNIEGRKRFFFEKRNQKTFFDFGVPPAIGMTIPVMGISRLF